MTVSIGPLLIFFIILACCACLFAFGQRRQALKPAKTPEQAAFRAQLSALFPYSQLGVTVHGDGFVYGNLTNTCLGQFSAASVTVGPAPSVTKVKQQIGHAVVTFTDGTPPHLARYGMRNHAIAVRQAEKFNGLAKAAQSTQFKRTRPANMA